MNIDIDRIATQLVIVFIVFVAGLVWVAITTRGRAAGLWFIKTPWVIGPASALLAFLAAWLLSALGNSPPSPPDLPPGAVIAFDRAGGCPKDQGWVPFDEGQGRFIIGVGGDYELPYVAGQPKYQTGGAETHTLTVDEMPAHSHDFTGRYIYATSHSSMLGGRQILPDPRRVNAGRDSSGGGNAHNNMPPYIALYFCKKEG